MHGLGIAGRNEVQVIFDLGEPVKLHASSDPSANHAFFVIVEARARLFPEDPEETVVLFRRDRVLAAKRSLHGPLVFEKLRRKVFWREHSVRLARCNGRERHAVEFRRLGVLDKHGPARGPHRLAAAGPVRSRAGEDHGNGTFARILRERREKFINGEMNEPFRVHGRLKEAVLQTDFPARRSKVKPSGLDLQAIGDLLDHERG
jgi:hypothetical protein